MPILPKSSAKSGGNPDTLSPGIIVMYEHDGAPLLGEILEFKKTRPIIFNQRGRETEIPPERIFSLKTHLPSNLTTRQARQEYLEKLMNDGKSAAQKISLEEIWSLVGPDGAEMSCHELCRTYFGGDKTEDLLALRLALLNDKVFFKRNRQSFQPRSGSTIEELRKAEAERQKKLELQERALKFFSLKRLDPALEIPRELDPLLEALEGVAAERGEIDPSTLREVKDFLARAEEQLKLPLNGSQYQRAYTFLKETGYFGRFINLHLIRHGIPLKFNEPAATEAVRINRLIQEGNLPSALGERIDLSQLDSFTIDDPVTKDMDDALSLERTEAGFRLGVHISDVAGVIAPDSPADREAKRRATSLYLPDATINMFPEVLSQDGLSLKAGETRPAVSYLFDIDHRYEIKGVSIVRSMIKVKRRMNYEEADHLLEEGSYPWDVLHQIGASSEGKRMAQGAMRIHKREVLVTLNQDQSLTINEVDEEAPARSLVSEMAILANSATAAFAVKNNIPLFFRGQENPDQSHHLRERNAPSGPAQDYQIRFSLKKSTVATRPSPHSSLGLKEYCQATSPIRRYYDLCNQRQIVSFLETGKPLYSAADLEKIMDHTDAYLGRATLAARDSRRLWLLYYMIESGMSTRQLSGTVVRIDLKSPLIELDDIFLVIGARSARRLALGDRVNLKILSVDPPQDTVRAEVI